MDLLPISALQHLLYCERQCALIHIERLWEENYFTAEGRVMHERAHQGPSESRPEVRIARGLRLVSHRLGLQGQADVVEFYSGSARGPRAAEGGPPSAFDTIIPIEYKRGKPKAHRADEVQLCAQALCLEEMLGASIEHGCLFYGKTKRRLDVNFDQELRALTVSLNDRLHAMIAEGQTPPPVFESKKCGACSLIDVCVPRLSKKTAASRYFTAALEECLA